MNIAIILSWIWSNIFKLGILSIILLNIRKVLDIFILQPLQGDDKKTSMNELAKFIILGLLVWVIYVNGARTTQWAPYSDATVAALIGGVFAIAAIKPVAVALSRKPEDKVKIEEIEES
jgi:hypothetical protein